LANGGLVCAMAFSADFLIAISAEAQFGAFTTIALRLKAVCFSISRMPHADKVKFNKGSFLAPKKTAFGISCCSDFQN
jgi:hypothetical protein